MLLVAATAVLNDKAKEAFKFTDPAQIKVMRSLANVVKDSTFLLSSGLRIGKPSATESD